MSPSEPTWHLYRLIVIQYRQDSPCDFENKALCTFRAHWELIELPDFLINIACHLWLMALPIRAQLAVARTLTLSPLTNPMVFVMISKSRVLILASEWLALVQTDSLTVKNALLLWVAQISTAWWGLHGCLYPLSTNLCHSCALALRSVIKVF